MAKLGKGGLEDIINSVTASLSDIKVGALINKVENTLGQLSLDEEKASVSLNLDALGLDLSTITVEISYNQNGLSNITLSELNIEGNIVNIELSFKDYVAPQFNKEQFVAIDPAYKLIGTFEKLIDQTAFRLQFDADIDRKQEGLKNITLNGDIEFDIQDMFGFGDVTIIDSKDYKHHVQADMKSPENIIFAYNSKLKGKFNTNTLIEIKDLLLGLLENPDKHFMELFADLLDALQNSPIVQVINGDYGMLLEYKLIDNLSVNENKIECDVCLDILELDMPMIHLCFEYETNNEDFDINRRYLLFLSLILSNI